MSTATGIPKNFAVANVTESTVELTWLPPNEEEEENNLSYQVFMRKAGGSLFKKNPETLFVTKKTSYTITDLEKGVEYEFWVQSGYIGKWGKWSERIVVRTFLPFSWKECSDSNNSTRNKYAVDRKNPRIATMVDEYSKSTIPGNTPIPLDKVTSWSIKILSSKGNNGFGVFVGVAPEDIVQDEDNYIKCGWYLDCYDSTLCSGVPHRYRNKEYGPRKENGEYVHTGDSVGVLIDMTKGELSFVLNGVNLGVAYEGIPLDKPLVPCVLLKWKDDSVELDYRDNITQGSNSQTTGSTSEGGHCDLVDAYPQDYEGPTLKNALLQAGLTEEQAEAVCTACYKKADEMCEGWELPENFTVDDAAAVAMYTFDFGTGNFDHNPCTIINNAIRKRNADKVAGLVYLFMSALRRLPKHKSKRLYRGIKHNVEKSNYVEGDVITWPAFSSAYSDMEAAKKFMTVDPSDGKTSGTMFVIKKSWEYDIWPYSLCPDNREFILEPGSQFKVISVLNEEFVTVTLEMVESPLVLPQLFGEGKII